MKKLTVILIILFASISAFTQQKNEEIFKTQTIELITPWVHQGNKVSFSNDRRLKSCLDFESLSYDCGRLSSVNYGTRIGINWDIFQVTGGVLNQTRMVEIGKYGWNDKFMIPYVEPWPALAPGERRTITVNASGVPAPPPSLTDAVAGMNGNGSYTPIPRPKSSAATTYANANVKRQVSSTVKDKDGKIRADAYTPTVEIKWGYMYAVHVVESTRDYYVIVHVDEVERGESVKLSFIKLDFSAL